MWCGGGVIWRWCDVGSVVVMVWSGAVLVWCWRCGFGGGGGGDGMVWCGVVVAMTQFS